MAWGALAEQGESVVGVGLVEEAAGGEVVALGLGGFVVVGGNEERVASEKGMGAGVGAGGEVEVGQGEGVSWGVCER